VRYKTASAFRTALESHLQARSSQTGLSLVRLRKSVAFDRLLARLLVVAEGRWVLKGALALDFRLGDKTRTTKDMDLVRQDDAAMATADFLEAQALDLGDYFSFVIEQTDQLNALQDGAAIRCRARVELAGRTFEQIVIDIGFGNPLGWEPDLLAGSDLLTFAGIDAIQVPVLPLEQHVAEKVHAYTRAYGTGSMQSTRVKDLVDIVLIAGLATFSATHLRSAFAGTFAGRGLQALPSKLPLPPAEWSVPYRKLALTVGINPDVERGHALAASFLDPILGKTVNDEAHWDYVSQLWRV